MGPVSDRLLRTLALPGQPARDYSSDGVVAIRGEPLPARFTMRDTRNKWVGEL